MRALTLNPDELCVETFATETVARGKEAVDDRRNHPTHDPMDCPETLPQFCRPTDLC